MKRPDLRPFSPYSTFKLPQRKNPTGSWSDRVSDSYCAYRADRRRERQARARALADLRRIEVARLESNGMHSAAIARKLKVCRATICQDRKIIKIQAEAKLISMRALLDSLRALRLKREGEQAAALAAPDTPAQAPSEPIPSIPPKDNT